MGLFRPDLKLVWFGDFFSLHRYHSVGLLKSTYGVSFGVGAGASASASASAGTSTSPLNVSFRGTFVAVDVTVHGSDGDRLLLLVRMLAVTLQTLHGVTSMGFGGSITSQMCVLQEWHQEGVREPRRIGLGALPGQKTHAFKLQVSRVHAHLDDFWCLLFCF